MKHKHQTKHSARMQSLANRHRLPTDEGKWRISFVFDGQNYSRSHQLTESEIKHMKDLCAEFGDAAADQIIWRAAIKGVAMVSEALMSQAGLDYVKKEYKGPAGPASDGKTEVTYLDVVDQVQESAETLAALTEYVESKKPLPEAEAFSPEAAAKIQQDTMGEQL